MIPKLDEAKVEVELARVLEFSTHHCFINCDMSDPRLARRSLA